MKKPNCPLTGEWIRKMVYVYMTKDDSATAKREMGHLSTAPERER